jgi:hypothetical protein
MYLGMSIGGTVAAYISGMVYLIIHRKEIPMYRGVKPWLYLLIILNLLFIFFINHKADAYKGHGGNRLETMASMQMDTRARYWTEMLPIAWMKPWGWGLGQLKYVMPMIQTPTHLEPIHRQALYRNIGDKRTYGKAIDAHMKKYPDFLEKPRWSVIWLEAHNEYMEIWFQCGIFALLLTFGAIVATLVRKANTIAKYGFLTSCISAIWFFSWQIVPLAIISTFYLGVIYAEDTV